MKAIFLNEFFIPGIEMTKRAGGDHLHQGRRAGPARGV